MIGIKTPIAIERIIRKIESTLKIKITTKGKTTALMMDARETNRKRKNTEKKTRAVASTEYGNNPIQTPTVVATPLPPLKFIYTGKM